MSENGSSMDTLDDKYEVIVLGTDLTQAIVSGYSVPFCSLSQPGPAWAPNRTRGHHRAAVVGT